MLPRDPLAASGAALAEADCLLAPSLLQRLRARLQAGQLDRELADGADPASCILLAARAAQLVARSWRARIANGLERLALGGGLSYGRFGVRPSPAATQANRLELLDLVAELRRERPVYAGGVAALRLLIVDGAGPAYSDRRGEALHAALEDARRRLAG